HRILAEIAATRTVADALHGRVQRAGQAPPARAFALEQVESHALRTLGPYPGQAAQRVHEFVEESGAGHQVRGMESREWGVGKARAFGMIREGLAARLHPGLGNRTRVLRL